MGQVIDLTGQRFGRLTVLGMDPQSSRGYLKWSCVCDCGTATTTAGKHLRYGLVESCGCLRAERLEARRRGGMVGQTFARLTVTGRSEQRRGESVLWDCTCTCGKTTTAVGSALRSGKKKSCGCLLADWIRETKTQDVVTYLSAHARVRRLRGPAKDHACIDCGVTAIDWSYTGGDPNQLIDDQPGRYGCAYSLDPDYYAARCRPCHATYDAAARRAVSA